MITRVPNANQSTPSLRPSTDLNTLTLFGLSPATHAELSAYEIQRGASTPITPVTERFLLYGSLAPGTILTQQRLLAKLDINISHTLVDLLNKISTMVLSNLASTLWSLPTALSMLFSTASAVWRSGHPAGHLIRATPRFKAWVCTLARYLPPSMPKALPPGADPTDPLDFLTAAHIAGLADQGMARLLHLLRYAARHPNRLALRVGDARLLRRRQLLRVGQDLHLRLAHLKRKEFMLDIVLPLIPCWHAALALQPDALVCSYRGRVAAHLPTVAGCKLQGHDLKRLAARAGCDPCHQRGQTTFLYKWMLPGTGTDARPRAAVPPCKQDHDPPAFLREPPPADDSDTDWDLWSEADEETEALAAEVVANAPDMPAVDWASVLNPGPRKRAAPPPPGDLPPRSPPRRRRSVSPASTEPFHPGCVPSPKRALPQRPAPPPYKVLRPPLAYSARAVPDPGTRSVPAASSAPSSAVSPTAARTHSSAAPRATGVRAPPCLPAPSAPPAPPPGPEPDPATLPLGGAEVSPMHVDQLLMLAASFPEPTPLPGPSLVNLLELLDGTNDCDLPPVVMPDSTPWPPSRSCQAATDALAQGLRAPVSRRERRFVGRSTVFPVLKSNMITSRLILWPEHFNSLITSIPCDLPDLSQDLSRAWAAGARYAVTLDGVGFFNQFPIPRWLSEAFSAKVDGHYVRPTRLPMGWRWSPSIANRTLKLLLRACGLADCSIVWIDNVLIWGVSPSDVQSKLAAFSDLAATVNFQWTIDDQGTVVPFLGTVLDFSAGTVAFSPKFQTKMHATALTTGTDTGFVDLQYLAGLANWTCSVSKTPLVRIFHLLRAVSEGARFDPVALSLGSHCPSPGRVPTSAAMCQDLALCKQLVGQVFPMHTPVLPPLDFTVFTDASDTMGGTVFMQNAATIFMTQWAYQHSELLHINLKELHSIFYALQLFEDQHDNHAVHLFSDNAVSVSVCNSGYTRSPALAPVLSDILQWCTQHNIQLHVHYIPTEQNPADYPSRVMPSRVRRQDNWDLPRGYFPRGKGKPTDRSQLFKEQQLKKRLHEQFRRRDLARSWSQDDQDYNHQLSHGPSSRFGPGTSTATSAQGPTLHLRVRFTPTPTILKSRIPRESFQIEPRTDLYWPPWPCVCEECDARSACICLGESSVNMAMTVPALTMNATFMGQWVNFGVVAPPADVGFLLNPADVFACSICTPGSCNQGFLL
eukprot:gene1864-2955_t